MPAVCMVIVYFASDLHGRLLRGGKSELAMRHSDTTLAVCTFHERTFLSRAEQLHADCLHAS